MKHRQVSFLRLEYSPSGVHIKTGVKKNRTPHNAVGGGCGTFVIYDRAKLFLELEVNGKPLAHDIYLLVKQCTNDRRITKKLRNKLQTIFQHETTWLNKKGKLDLEAIVLKACQQLN
jgi:hypothetical protein